jgi:hypothetical protein
MCELNGCVSLRWFKNYILSTKNLQGIKNLVQVLE